MLEHAVLLLDLGDVSHPAPTLSLAHPNRVPPPFKETQRQLLSTAWSVMQFESGSSVGSPRDTSGPRNLSDSARLEVCYVYESEHPRWGEEV